MRLELLALYKSGSSWDWDFIKEKMTDIRCVGLQRAMINLKKRDMNVMIQKWPFLFEFRGLVSHLEKITGLESYFENFDNFVEKDLQDFTNFLTIQSPKRILNLKIKKSLCTNGVQQSFLGLINMVCNHFEEDFSSLARCAEVSVVILTPNLFPVFYFYFLHFFFRKECYHLR